VERVQRFGPVLRLQHPIAGLTEDAVRDAAGISLVVDYENRRCCAGEGN
jgi:hypothetical protein